MTENFGITLAEALACEVPCVAIHGMPWQALDREYAGYWVPIGVDPLVSVLCELMSMSDEERARMGRLGREWIERDFSWPGVGAKMKAAYSWLLGRGEKPEFVIED